MTKSKVEKALIRGLKEALSHEKGQKKLKSMTREIPKPAPKWSKTDIKKIRNSLGVSQPTFAEFLNVKTPTIRSWEQGQKQPSGAASRLLQILATQPEVFTHPAVMKQRKTV